MAKIWRTCVCIVAALLAAAAGGTRENAEAGASLSAGGTAPGLCSFTTAPRVVDSTNMRLGAAGEQSASVLIDSLIDESKGTLATSTIKLEVMGICNEPHQLSVSTSKGGLTLENRPPEEEGTFLDHVNYAARIEWAGREVMLRTSSNPGSEVSFGLINGANQGPLYLTLSIDEETNSLTTPVLRGSYVDSLDINLSVPF